VQLKAVIHEGESILKTSISKPKAEKEEAGQEKEFYRLVAAGTQFETSNRHDLATECFEDALKIKPGSIGLHLELSVIYGEKIGDSESKQRAINHCEEVLKIDPNNLSAKFNLAVYTNHIKGSEKSLSIYLDAEKLIRKQGMINSLIDGKLNIFVGHDYKNTGDRNEAKLRYEKAITILNNLSQKGDSNSAFWRDDAQTNLKKLSDESAQGKNISLGSNGSIKLNTNRKMNLPLLTIISMFVILFLTPIWEDVYKSFKTYMIAETYKSLAKPFSDTVSIVSVKPLAFVPYTPKNPEVIGQKKAIIIVEIKLRNKRLANNIRVNFEIDDGTGRHVTSQEWDKISGQQGLVFSMFYPDIKLVRWTPDIPYTGIEAIATNRQKPFKLWVIVRWEDLDGTEHNLESYSELRYDENSKLYYFDERENRYL